VNAVRHGQFDPWLSTYITCRIVSFDQLNLFDSRRWEKENLAVSYLRSNANPTSPGMDAEGLGGGFKPYSYPFLLYICSVWTMIGGILRRISIVQDSLL
jgi:hypothetical protein